MENLEQGTRVKFSVDSIKGEGKIVGLATNGQPIIGKLYIIEPDEPIKNEVYNYTHIAVYEYQLEVFKEKM